MIKSGSWLTRAGRLVVTWVSAATVAFTAIMIVFTLFFGRNKVVLNETIYEGHRFVGQAGQTQLSTREGHGLTTFGENGLIVNKELDPTAYGVLFVGDSFVRAKQVADKDKFTEIVERSWNAAHPDKPIQTLNLGLGGQSIPTYLSFGRNMDQHFQPELVFLMLSEDDFMDLKRRPKKLDQVAASVAKPDGSKLILTEPETANALHHLVNDLGIRSFFGQLQLQTHNFLTLGRTDSQAEPGKPPDSAMYAETGDEKVRIQLQALQDIWGDRLVILYKPPINNMGRGEPPDYRNTITVEMESLGIPYINLYPPLLKAFQQKRPPMGFANSIIGRGHLNQYGHALVAEEIVKFMEAANGL